MLWIVKTREATPEGKINTCEYLVDAKNPGDASDAVIAEMNKDDLVKGIEPEIVSLKQSSLKIIKKTSKK